jgi:hypothetical protein
MEDGRKNRIPSIDFGDVLEFVELILNLLAADPADERLISPHLGEGSD